MLEIITLYIAAGCPMQTNEWNLMLKKILTVSVLVILPFYVFFPALKGGFIWDDESNFVKNPILQNISIGSFKLAFQTTLNNMYTPVTWLTIMIERILWDIDPFMTRFLNLIMHVFNNLLVLLLIIKLTGNYHLAFLTAVIFSFHPMQVETIAWAIQRRTVLYTVFFLTAMISYMEYLKSSDEFRKSSDDTSNASNSRMNTNPAWWYACSITAMMLSCLSKPLAVTLPPLLLLCEYYMGREIGWKSIRRIIPFALLSAVFSVLTLWISVPNIRPVGLLRQILLASHSYIFYIGKTFWPINLSIIHAVPKDDTAFFLSFALVLSVLIIMSLSMRRNKMIFFGIVWYTVNILPFVVCPVGVEILAAEHFHYVSIIGIAVIIGYAFERIPLHFSFPDFGKLMWHSAIILILAVLCCQSYSRSMLWDNTKVLFGAARRLYPDNKLIVSILGTHLMNDRQYTRAIECFDVLFQSSDSLSSNKYIKCLAYRAFCKLNINAFEDALNDINKVIKQKQDQAMYYEIRGTVLFNLGKYENAMLDFTKALEMNTQFSMMMYKNLTLTCVRLNRYHDAIKYCNEIINMDPENWRCYYFRAMITFPAAYYRQFLKDLYRIWQLKPQVLLSMIGLKPPEVEFDMVENMQ